MSESYNVGDRFKINGGLREFEIQGKIPLREYAKIHNIEAPTVKTEYFDPDEIMYEIQFLPTKEESDKVLEYLRTIKIKLEEEEKIKLEEKKWVNNNSSITKLNENLAEIAQYTHNIDVPQPLELLIRNLNVLGKRYGLGKLTTGRIDTDYLDAKTIKEFSSPAVGGAKRRRRTTKRRKNKRKRRKTR